MALNNKFHFTAKVWIYPGRGAWYFVDVPKNLSAELTKTFADFKRGWGSLKVVVTVGATSWVTSLFPDNKHSTYLLPLKAAVRKQAGIEVDDTVDFGLEIIV